MASTLSRLSEASATSRKCSGRLSRPVHLGPLVRVGLEPELGGDYHLSALRSEGLAHELLVGQRAVDLGGVEEGDAAVDGRPDQGERLLLVHGRSVAEAHSHAAGPERRNLQVALSKFT